MNIRRTFKRAALGLVGAGLVSMAGQSASAIDLFKKKGCCNKGGSVWVSQHAVPVRAVGHPVPVATGYTYVPVPPPIAVRRQLPVSPPDPVPKWARPPGTVPVLAIQAPPPRWIHPSALAAPRQVPAANFPNGAAGFAPGVLPSGVPAMNAPLQPVPDTLQGLAPAQPAPAASAMPGVPVTSRTGQSSSIILTQADDVDSLLNDSQPGGTTAGDPGAASAAPAQPGNGLPGNAQPLSPLTPVQPAPLAAPLQQWPQGPLPGAGAFQGTPLPPSAFAPVPARNVPYVTAPQPYGPPVGPRANSAHNSKVYGFDDSGKRPPGTLGKTYLRPTRMLDWDKHPRVGQLDVEILDTLRHGLAEDVHIKVTARDIYNHFKPLEGFLGEDDVWHFESEPLLPTVPHIYDVKFELVRERTEYERRYGRLFERIIEDKLGTLGVRRIRLIPGRIVDLVMY